MDIITISLIAIVILALYRYIKGRNDYFNNLDIPGPKPLPFIGNMLSLKDGKMYHVALQEWTAKFGKIYGYFEGGLPVLVLSDLDALQEVLVKQFSSFHARKMFPIQPDPDTGKIIHLFLARGQRWKRMRNITNPTFTNLKMKQMSPLIERLSAVMADVVAEKARGGKPFDIYAVFKGLTLDVIGQCAFGLDTDAQRDPDDVFLDLCQRAFDHVLNPGLIHVVAIMFPELRGLWTRLAKATDRLRGVPFPLIEDRIRAAVEARRAAGKAADGRVDLLGILLDAEADEAEIDVKGEATEGGTGAGRSVNRKLTTEELVAVGILFLLAGYETTSTAMAYLAWLLAKNPEAQAKLRAEIAAAKEESEGKELFDVVGRLPYLDMVIHEVLRLYPVATP